jgi:hypothetical protein
MSFSLFAVVVRCAGFVAATGGVHFAGLRIWRREQGSNAKDAKPPATGNGIWVRTVPGGLFWLVLLFVVLYLVLCLMMPYLE